MAAKSDAAYVKDAEKEALVKVGKVVLPKEVTAKAPAMPKSASAVANVGTAGTL